MKHIKYVPITSSIQNVSKLHNEYEWPINLALLGSSTSTFMEMAVISVFKQEYNLFTKI